MLNHITIMGRLVRDPELRRTATGAPVASFTIACDRDFADKQTGQKETDFVDIVVWRNTAEWVCHYFEKGRMAVVSGRLQIRKWKDKDGNNRQTAEIVADSVYFGDSKQQDNSNSNNGAQGYAGPYNGYPQQAPAQDFAILSDDDAKLPF